MSSQCVEKITAVEQLALALHIDEKQLIQHKFFARSPLAAALDLALKSKSHESEVAPFSPDSQAGAQLMVWAHEDAVFYLTLDMVQVEVPGTLNGQKAMFVRGVRPSDLDLQPEA